MPSPSEHPWLNRDLSSHLCPSLTLYYTTQTLNLAVVHGKIFTKKDLLSRHKGNYSSSVHTVSKLLYEIITFQCQSMAVKNKSLCQQFTLYFETTHVSKKPMIQVIILEVAAENSICFS